MPAEKISLVLLPGLDGTGRLFRRFVAALPAGFEIHPVSYPADGKPTLAELGRQAAKQLPAGRFVLLAESFGGLVALSLPPSALAAVRGIVFVGAFAEPPRPLLLRMAPLAALAPDLLAKAPAFLLRQYCLGRDATVADLAFLRDGLAGIAPGALSHRLDLVAARHAFDKSIYALPCCYLRATGDRLLPAGAAKWFAQHFRDCAVEDIDGPHFLLQMKPQEAALAVERAVHERFCAGAA